MARGRKATPKQSPRIHPLIPALIAVVVCGVLVLVVAGIADDDPAPVAASSTTTSSTTTSLVPLTTTTTLPDPVPVGPLLAGAPVVDAPRTYRIHFDVVESGLARQETVTVRRPYESLVISTRDGRQISGTASSLTDLRTYLSDRSAWFTVQPLRHRAAFDQRPAGVIGAMVHLGLVEEVGTDTYAGRSCTVYRTGDPTSSNTATPPTEDQVTDLCLDDDGLLLWERWQLGGNVVMERTATAVETGIDVDPAIFDPGPEIEESDELTAAFASIAVEADEETLARLRTRFDPPPGYTHDASVFRAGNPSGGGSSSEIVRFYSSGSDLLEISEHFLDRPADLGGDAAVLVEVEGWDEVWLDPDFRASSVRTRLSTGSFVELRHHDIGFLFDALDRLTLEEG